MSILCGLFREETAMSKHVEFSSKTGKCSGELAEPSGTSGKVGAVVVIQEWHGITDQIRSKVDRFAEDGFLALAPDLYHGKVAKNDEEAQTLMSGLDFGKAVGEIGAAVQALKEQPRSNGKVGVVGFCLGGALTLAAAANVPGIACAVPFYGLPDLSKLDLSKVTAPILAHFAGHDDWASPDAARQLQKKLQELGKSMELHVYEDAGHAFMRQTDPQKYHEASAKKAWERTIAFLKQQLN
jgi:carboxymethylenebutenolidase